MGEAWYIGGAISDVDLDGCCGMGDSILVNNVRLACNRAASIRGATGGCVSVESMLKYKTDDKAVGCR
jgi:hypothetical protein